uniref:Uncharacterized protein n=1 Tax=Ananas comosus var. bracteatus TaxID=296719 RepID=A0A6V7NJ86_ANACO|nr:unnamed protein product [Ananas comosus var. bracteatus]
MSLAHGDPLRRPIPHGGYESRWLSPECRLVGSDPHKHVRMSTMASSRMSSHKYQVLMSNNMECIECPKGLSLCHHVSNMEYIADVQWPNTFPLGGRTHWEPWSWFSPHVALGCYRFARERHGGARKGRSSVDSALPQRPEIAETLRVGGSVVIAPIPARRVRPGVAAKVFPSGLGNPTSSTSEAKAVRERASAALMTFKRFDPSTFDGENADPLIVELWIDFMETPLGICAL